MSNWIKWWKDKLLLQIMGTAIGSVGLAFIPAYFLSWGWILSILVAVSGGVIMRKLIIKKLDEVSNEIFKKI